MIKIIIQGFLIGCAKIIPGFSGSFIAIMFGVYEKTLRIISDLKNITLKKIMYLFFLATGIIMGIILFSLIIKYLLKTNYFLFILLFTGLIIGSIKDLFLKININKGKLKLIIYFVLSFTFVILLSFIRVCKVNAQTYLYFPLGIIEAFTTLLPGVSGTAVYMVLGVYDLILNLYINVFNLKNIFNLILFGGGFIIGVLILSKILLYILKKYSNTLFVIILGNMCASIFILLKDAFMVSIHFYDVIVGIVFLVFGYFISNKLNHLF